MDTSLSVIFLTFSRGSNIFLNVSHNTIFIKALGQDLLFSLSPLYPIPPLQTHTATTRARARVQRLTNYITLDVNTWRTHVIDGFFSKNVLNRQNIIFQSTIPVNFNTTLYMITNNCMPTNTGWRVVNYAYQCIFRKSVINV